MPLSREPLLGLVDTIYGASLTPALWPSVVAEIARVNDSTRALLLTPKGRYQQGMVSTDEDMLPHGEFLCTRWYRDFLARIDIARVCVGVVFGVDSSPLLPMAMSVYRSAGEPPFLAQHRRILQILIPHVSRALGVMYRLRKADLQIAAGRAALDGLKLGVVLMSADGAVLHTNRRANRLLDQNGGALRLRPDSKGVSRLEARGAEASAALRSALAEVLRPQTLVVPHFSSGLAIPQSEGRRSLALQMAPLPETNPFSREARLARAVVFITDPDDRTRVDPALLQGLYGVTPAEARVADVLVTGGSLKDAAQACRISLGTAASHLRRLYEKTGAARQADLVRLLGSLGSPEPS